MVVVTTPRTPTRGCWRSCGSPPADQDGMRARYRPAAVRSGRAEGSDDPGAGGRRHGLGAGAAAELGEDVVDDVLDRPLAVAQSLGDPAGVLAVGEHPQHGQL